jgi:hypothetical protein
LVLMPLRNATAVVWRPKGLSDALDGGNAFPGAMQALQNLVPSPDTADQWVPRPARTFLTDMVAHGYQGPGIVQNFTAFGDRLYGMVTSALNPGHDEPFVVEQVTGQPVAVAGITRDNTPSSLLPTGPTQLPLFAIVGAYVVVTHPGFPGGIVNPTGLTQTFTANAVNGSRFLTGFFVGQFFPGMLLSDTGAAIPGSTFVLGTSPVDFNTTATGTAGNTFFDVADPSQVAVGQILAGPGVAGYVTGIAGTTVTFSGILGQSLGGDTVSFHGELMEMSQAATADVTNDTVTAATGGDRTPKFGWWDLTGLVTTITGTTTNTSPNIVVDTIFGLSPGQLVSGAGVTPGSRIAQLLNPTVTAAPGFIASGHGDMTLTVTYPAGTPLPLIPPALGSGITGPGLVAGTTVTAAGYLGSGPTSATLSLILSAPAVADSPSGSVYSIGGLYEIVMDQPATASATVPITITGGTVAAPLWCAGDTQIYNLPSTPTGVGVFNGRAYFACGPNGAPFSDALNPALRTYQYQAIIPGNREDVTHCVGQPLVSPITGGITSAIYLFQGIKAIQQVTGDPVTNNLADQALNVATGTLAPASIIPTTIGMAFISPEGMRVIDFSGQISQPIGKAGEGVTVPFITASDPSRIVAAGTGDTIRVAVTITTAPENDARFEYWYDLSRKVWGGPHTIKTRAIASAGNTFFVAAFEVPAKLYRSPSLSSGTVDYEEDDNDVRNTLVWRYQTVLLPDNEGMAQNAVNETTLGIKLPSDQPVTVSAVDESGALLDSVVIPGAYTMPAFGGPNLFGTGLFYAVTSFFHQEPLNWHRELNFKQAIFVAVGVSRFGSAIGTLRLRAQRAGYLMQPYPYVSLDVSVPPLPGAPIVNTFAQALVVAGTVPAGTPIGAVLSKNAHTGLAVAATLQLGFANTIALQPYEDSNITGNTYGNTVIDTLSANAIAAGWLPGHRISDTLGAIPDGTFIASIDPGGLSAVLSQPALRTLAGTTFIVEGDTMVTTWPVPIQPTRIIAQIQAIAPAYLTSYFPFLVTVT